MTEISKWWQTIKISWSRYTAYRMSFFLQIIGPSLVFFFIKYQLWDSIYKGDPNLVINGYTFSAMITYHLWSFIVSLIAQGHNSMNLSEEIRLGRISTYLIYPFNLWEFHTASFLSFQILQTFISLFTLILMSVLGIFEFTSLQFILNGFFYCMYISFFWFIAQYLIGILGFWLDETWILRVMLNVLTGFLSGAIIPLEFYPSWLIKILNYTPFPYLSYYPIKTFMGQTTHLISAYSIIGVWMIVVALITSWVWKKGIKLYTAAGM